MTTQRFLAAVALGWALAVPIPLRAAIRCVPLTHPGPCDARYATIQEAVDEAASSGDTVRVAAGAYPEQVVVSGKSLQLLGARAGEDARGRTGSESILTHPDGPLSVCGSGLVVDGFTVTGAVNPDGSWVGLGADQSSCAATGELRIENNVIRDNIVGLAIEGISGTKTIRHNWLKDNAVVPEWSAGILSYSPTANLLVAENRFEGHAADSIAFHGNAQSGFEIVGNRVDRRIFLVYTSSSRIATNVWAAGAGPGALLEIAGVSHQITIEGNKLRPLDGPAVLVSDPFGVGPSSGIVVVGNCIEGASVIGLRVAAGAHPGGLPASQNWWGSASGPSGAGPGTGAAIVDPSGVVAFAGWQTDDGGCGCAYRADGTICDDGNACTAEDHCAADLCASSAPTSCDDADACTVDTCDPVEGCASVLEVCDDDNPCTDDGCDPQTGCTFVPDDSNPCQDPDPCWVAHCAAGLCLADPRPCDDGDPCTFNGCNRGTGQCEFTPRNCDDGNACTDDHCVAGACSHAPHSCDDGFACSVDACDPANGCSHLAPACNDNNMCTIDSCNAQGCVHLNVPDGTLCPQSSCMLNQACQGGVCQGGSSYGYLCRPNPTGCSIRWCDPSPGGVCHSDPLCPPDADPCTIDLCVSGGNTHCEHRIQCADGTCEVPDVRFGADRTTLSWSLPNLVCVPASMWDGYEVVRGLVSALPVGSGTAETVSETHDTPALSDPANPPAGQAFWYIVRWYYNPFFPACFTWGREGLHGAPSTERHPSAPLSWCQ